MPKLDPGAIPVAFNVEIRHPEMVGAFTHRSRQPSPVHAVNDAAHEFSREHNMNLRDVTIVVTPVRA